LNSNNRGVSNFSGTKRNKQNYSIDFRNKKLQIEGKSMFENDLWKKCGK